MQTLTLPLGPWQPDAPELAAGSTEAKNVIPGEADSYRPLPALASVSGAALDARCQGGKAMVDAEGNVRLFAGDVTKLYRRIGDTFVDASGEAYTVPMEEQWAFEHWEDKVIAVNIGNVPQVASLETGNFAPIGYDTSDPDVDDNEPQPPRARHILHDRGPRHLILGNLWDHADGWVPRRVRWSGALDYNRWGDQVAFQAGYQDMPEAGGAVQGLVGAPYPTVFQERMIRRMSYIGGELTYGFDTLETGVGALLGGSAIVSWGSRTFFWGEDGAYMWQGQTAEPIGNKQVDRWFRSRLNYGQRALSCGAFDPRNRLVIWAIPTGEFSGTSIPSPDTLVIFSLREGRWSWGEQAVEYLLSVPDRGYTLEELDQFGLLDAVPGLDGLDAFGSLEDLDDFGSLDDLDGLAPDVIAWSLDSKVYQGGSITIGAFDTAHAIGTFRGPNMAATIDTAERQAAAGQRMFVNAVRPLVDLTSGSMTAAMGMRSQTLGDALTFGADSAVNVAGYCPVRASGRYGRARVSIAAGAAWTHAQGVEVTMRAEGRR